ncbi:MAG: rod shape-determining protein MreD [Anaerolineae bacterium]|nr:rod shape-determining protein MreD [Anaerolineae bacterium]
MLSLYVVLPLLTLVVLLQSTVLAPISILGGRPDLVLLVVVGWAFIRGPEEGVVWAFISGLLLDLFSGGPLGGVTLALLVVALFVGQKWGQELGATFLQLFLLVLIAAFVYHILILLALGWTGYATDWRYGLARIAAPSAILNAVLAPFVHYPLAWLDRRTRPEGLTFDGF